LLDSLLQERLNQSLQIPQLQLGSGNRFNSYKERILKVW